MTRRDDANTDEVSAKYLATVLGVDPRSVKNFVDEGMPKLERGRYALAPCVRWYVDREVASARAGKALNELDLARQRKTVAEAQEAELRLAKAAGAVIDAEVYQEIVGQICDRMMSVIQNMPSNHSIALEQLGLTSAKAEVVLEHIATELTQALRSHADELEAEGNADDEAAQEHPASDAKGKKVRRAS